MIKRLYELALEADDTLNPINFDDIGEDIEDILDEQFEVDYAADGIQQAAFAANELSKIAEAVEAQSDQGACLSEPDTKLLSVAVEGVYERLGVSLPRELSMEDAEGATWGSRASRIKEQLYQILQALIEALRRAYENMRAYLNRLFSAAAVLEKYAAQQMRLYRGLEGKPSKESYESPRLAKLLYCPDAGLITTYDRLFTLVEDAENSATSGHIQLMTKMVDRFVGGGDIDELTTHFAAVFSGMFSNIFKHDADNEIIDAVGAPADTVVHTSEFLPGGYLAVIAVPKYADTIGKFVFAIKRPNDKESIDPILKVLSKEDILGFLDSIIKTCSKIRKFDIIEKKNGSLVDQLSQATKKLKNSNVSVSDKDRVFLKSLASIAPSLARGIHQQTFTFALSSFRALLEHCKKSAELYETK